MKYRITKFYTRLYIGVIVAAITAIGYIAYYYLNNRTDFAALFVILIPLAAILAGMYSLLFDFHAGKFSIDEDGITMYVGFKEYPHRWEEFCDCGIVGVIADAVGGRTTTQTYWIYFSARILSANDKIRFMAKTRRDLQNVAFFQYSKKSMPDVMEFVPEEFQNRLKQQLEQMERNMYFADRFYNK